MRLTNWDDLLATHGKTPLSTIDSSWCDDNCMGHILDLGDMSTGEAANKNTADKVGAYVCTEDHLIPGKLSLNCARFAEGFVDDYWFPS